MPASIVGFKDPRVDLHKKSPKIFAISMVFSLALVGFGIHMQFATERAIEQKKKAPPVIIQIEDIPETRHVVRAPAPKLGLPLEVDDQMMPDDVTIEETDLDFNEVAAPPPVLDIVSEGPVAEEVEEEIFELFAVEEQPERLKEIAPEYPEAAQRAGIEGVVFVRALVDKSGAVKEAQVLKGPDELHKAALDAALKTIFKPAKQNDMPVSCWVQMSFRFDLD